MNLTFDKLTIIFLLGLHFYKNGPPNLVLFLYYNIQKYIKDILNNEWKFFNLYLEYWNYLIDIDSDDDISIKNDEIVEKEINEIKYEDKYLKDIRRINKNWQFTEDEINEINEFTNKFFNSSKENILLKCEELSQKIIDIENEINDDNDIIEYNETLDETGYECETTLEERNRDRNEQIELFKNEYKQLKNDLENPTKLDEMKLYAKQNAEKFIINKRLELIKNCYVIEKTPLGNVLMIYDKERESFKYYADSTIPYRYLETVARKYVKLFNCRPIFVDMEEELKLFEEKLEKEQLIKKQKEEEEKLKNTDNQLTQNNNKKNVFAKFKTYNKDAGGKISMAPPPKNSIPNKQINETKENDKILLKERANRYTYEGKFANFNFLKKVERKVFNKKLGLSFTEFKKMKNN
jgi:hypothetical protein